MVYIIALITLAFFFLMMLLAIFLIVDMMLDFSLSEKLKRTILGDKVIRLYDGEK